MQKDLWKITCLYERALPTYVVYGEMPDGDKKILFTCSQHFQCCTCCDQCIIGLPCCLEYACCDQIIFQMDYKRNNAPFSLKDLIYKKVVIAVTAYIAPVGPNIFYI